MPYVQERTFPLNALDRKGEDTRHEHDIERAARAALRRSSYRAIREINCEYDSGVLTLRGRLSSFFLKQMAQCAVSHHLKGVAAVDNQLQVMPLPPEVATH